MDIVKREMAATESPKVGKTAWRVEGTLREFESFRPFNVWFDYPVHRLDTEGILRDVKAESMMPGRIEYASRVYKEAKPDRRTKMNEELETAFSACAIDGEASQKDMAEYLGVSERTVKNRIASHDGLTVKRGMVYQIGIAE